MDFKYTDATGSTFLIEGEFAYYLNKKGEVEDDCLLKFLGWSKYNPPGRVFKGNISLMFPGSMSGQKLMFRSEDIPIIEQIMEILPHNMGQDPYNERLDREKAEKEAAEAAALAEAAEAADASEKENE